MKQEIFYSLAKNSKEREAIDKIMEKYSSKITPYLKKLIEKSEAVRKQYIPSPLELQENGTATPFEEGKTGSECYGLERLYRDRVLITPHFDCPAYCRFCYKKSRVMRNKRNMTYAEIDNAIVEISKMENLRGALITGGEPLMDTKKLFYLLDKLMETNNVNEIRIGTRALLTMPETFTDEICDKLASYIRPDFDNPENSKYLAINVHFNHPDELTPEVLTACNKLTSKGITLRNQAVLLKGINDTPETMKHLFELLIRNNIIVYYMNHCMPVEGSAHLRTSVQKGQDIYKYLCTESSTIIPNYVYAPSGGKVHVGPDTQFNYMEIEGRKCINVDTLYKSEEFRKFTRNDLPTMHKETVEGLINAVYVDGMDN